MNYSWLFILLLLSLESSSCISPPRHTVPAIEELCIYPAYQGITIPVNIAPLNFLVRDAEIDAVAVRLQGASDSLLISNRGNKVTFPLKKWRKLLEKEVGRTIEVEINSYKAGIWYHYPSFTWSIAPHKIDPYLSYRLIEPGYEVWNTLQLRERCLESFEEKVIADNRLTGGNCMNCHTYGNNDGALSLFHLRGKGGGTVLNQSGKLRKLELKSDKMSTGATYGAFHPGGRYAVFSTNRVWPMLHTQESKRLEVYDSESDLMIVDFVENRIIQPQQVATKSELETFPCFSADGAYVYFCSAPAITLPDSIKELRYSLCRIAFDALYATWGEKIDTLWDASEQKGSVCHPKASPDGNYLLYTVAAYGTFPIWHRETNLQLLHLQTGKIDSLKQVNSNRSDTYHSWSSNSRWFAFASKREDGQYGRIYLAYIDESGEVTHPFVLPQKDPSNDDMNLKSYNIPELSRSSVPFTARDIEELAKQVTAEKMSQK